MVVKVVLYFRLTRKSQKPFPDQSRELLSELVKKEISNKFTLTSSFWEGDDVVAHLLTEKELLEAIRTNDHGTK